MVGRGSRRWPGRGVSRKGRAAGRHCVQVTDLCAVAIPDEHSSHLAVELDAVSDRRHQPSQFVEPPIHERPAGICIKPRIAPSQELAIEGDPGVSDPSGGGEPDYVGCAMSAIITAYVVSTDPPILMSCNPARPPVVVALREDGVRSARTGGPIAVLARCPAPKRATAGPDLIPAWAMKAPAILSVVAKKSGGRPAHHRREKRKEEPHGVFGGSRGEAGRSSLEHKNAKSSQVLSSSMHAHLATANLLANS